MSTPAFAGSVFFFLVGFIATIYAERVKSFIHKWYVFFVQPCRYFFIFIRIVFYSVGYVELMAKTFCPLGGILCKFIHRLEISLCCGSIFFTRWAGLPMQQMRKLDRSAWRFNQADFFRKGKSSCCGNAQKNKSSHYVQFKKFNRNIVTIFKKLHNHTSGAVDCMLRGWRFSDSFKSCLKITGIFL